MNKEEYYTYLPNFKLKEKAVSLNEAPWAKACYFLHIFVKERILYLGSSYGLKQVLHLWPKGRSFITRDKWDVLILRFLSFFKPRNKAGIVKKGPIPGSALLGYFLKVKDFKTNAKKR